MAEITYERLKNNIAEESVSGSQVIVTFKCPVTEKLYHAIGTMRPPNATAAAAQRSTTRANLGGLLRNALGGSRTAPPERPGTTEVYFDRAARERAVVQAFEPIAVHFAWDAARAAFVDAESMQNSLSNFDLQLRDHPIDGQWERSVVARMLAEIIAADGKVSDTEADFFNQILNSDTGTLADLLANGRLSRFELEECKPSARATMLMLAYGVALADEHLDERELKRLSEFARAFGVSLERDELMRHWASEKVIENMLLDCYADGRLDDAERERITNIAKRIGVNEALVAKIDIRVRKRLVG